MLLKVFVSADSEEKCFIGGKHSDSGVRAERAPGFDIEVMHEEEHHLESASLLLLAENVSSLQDKQRHAILNM